MNEFDELTAGFLNNHVDDAARVLQNLEPAKVAEFINSIPVRQSLSVLKRMSPHSIAQFFTILDVDKRNTVLREIGVQHAARILRQLGRDQCNAELDQMPSRFSLRVRMILSFPQGSVGAAMDPDILIASPEQPVEEVLALVKRSSTRHINNDIYVSNERQQLLGVVNISELIRANKKTLITNVMDKNIATLSARAALSAVTSNMGWLTRNTLPVLDRDDRLIGTLSYTSLFHAPKYSHEKNANMGYLLNDVMNAYSIGWLSLLDVVFSGKHR